MTFLKELAQQNKVIFSHPWIFYLKKKKFVLLLFYGEGAEVSNICAQHKKERKKHTCTKWVKWNHNKTHQLIILHSLFPEPKLELLRHSPINNSVQHSSYNSYILGSKCNSWSLSSLEKKVFKKSKKSFQWKCTVHSRRTWAQKVCKYVNNVLKSVKTQAPKFEIKTPPHHTAPKTFCLHQHV